MLQRLPVAALSKTGAFSASSTAPLRAAQRLSSVGTIFLGSVATFRTWVVFMDVHGTQKVRFASSGAASPNAFQVRNTHEYCNGTCSIHGASVTGVLPNNPRFRDAPCNRFDRLVHPLVRNPPFYRRGARVLSRRGRPPPSRVPMAAQGLAGLVRPCQVMRLR